MTSCESDAGDEQEGDACDGAQPGRWQRSRQVGSNQTGIVSAISAAAQASPTTTNSMIAQWERDRDVEHVTPAGSRRRTRPAGCRSRSRAAVDTDAVVVDRAHRRTLATARSGRRAREASIAAAMNSTPMPASNVVRPAGHERDDRRERERPDEEAQDDRAVREPRLRVDRREEEGTERRTSDPRSSEGRSTGDPG